MAALNIQFTTRALYGMREILGYIAQDNPLAAAKLAGSILKGLEHKARFPKSGRRIPEVPKHPLGTELVRVSNRFLARLFLSLDSLVVVARELGFEGLAAAWKEPGGKPNRQVGLPPDGQGSRGYLPSMALAALVSSGTTSKRSPTMP